MSICIAENIAGLGGVGGGAGANGQASQFALGAAARSYGVPVIKTTTGMTALFDVQLTKDYEGTIPSLLSDSDLITFICKKGDTTSGQLFVVDCSLVGDGIVHFSLGPEEVNYHQGLYFAAIHVVRDLKLIKVFKCCLLIQKGLTGAGLNLDAPLTILLVRMALYDTSALQNDILDDLLFSDIVIARCISRAVADWNEMPPETSNAMTPSNFPYRSNLCTGAVGHCLKMAAYRYSRNQMRHSNAGLTYDDNDKGQMYMQLAEQALQLWKVFIMTKKTEINMLLAMGTISDGYYLGYVPRW